MNFICFVKNLISVNLLLDFPSALLFPMEINLIGPPKCQLMCVWCIVCTLPFYFQNGKSNEIYLFVCHWITCSHPVSNTVHCCGTSLFCCCYVALHSDAVSCTRIFVHNLVLVSSYIWSPRSRYIQMRLLFEIQTEKTTYCKMATTFSNISWPIYLSEIQRCPCNGWNVTKKTTFSECLCKRTTDPTNRPTNRTNDWAQLNFVWDRVWQQQAISDHIRRSIRTVTNKFASSLCVCHE